MTFITQRRLAFLSFYRLILLDFLILSTYT